MKTVIDDQGLAWTRTSRCKNCIEVSPQGDFVLIRDSMSPNQHIKVVTSEFQSFIAGVKQGDFDKLP